MQDKFFLPRFRVVCRLAVGVLLLSIMSLGVMAGVASGSSTAHAAGGTALFGLQPVLYDPANPLTKSYFIFDSKPGTVINNRVRVTNVGTARGSVSLYSVDATTGQTSGAVYLNRDDPRKDVGAWVSLGSQQLTLNPGQSQIVSFQVTIPSTIRPGQHLGGIVAENLTVANNTPTPNTSKNTSTIQVTVKNLTIIAVEVNLPGVPVEQLSATGVQAGGEDGYQQLLLALNNAGTMMLHPYGTLQVTNAQGQTIENFSLKLDTFLPQTTINYPVTITGPALSTGDYQATLNLTYGHGQVLHYTTKFTVSQQQITQVFGSHQTQAPTSSGGVVFAGMTLWQLLLSVGGGLALLWLVGNMVYGRLAAARAKSGAQMSQFKRPTFK